MSKPYKWDKEKWEKDEEWWNPYNPAGRLKGKGTTSWARQMRRQALHQQPLEKEAKKQELAEGQPAELPQPLEKRQGEHKQPKQPLEKWQKKTSQPLEKRQKHQIKKKEKQMKKKQVENKKWQQKNKRVKSWEMTKKKQKLLWKKS